MLARGPAERCMHVCYLTFLSTYEPVVLLFYTNIKNTWWNFSHSICPPGRQTLNPLYLDSRYCSNPCAVICVKVWTSAGLQSPYESSQSWARKRFGHNKKFPKAPNLLLFKTMIRVNKVGADEIFHLAKCWHCKHKDLSWSLRIHIKVQGMLAQYL